MIPSFDFPCFSIEAGGGLAARGLGWLYAPLPHNGECGSLSARESDSFDSVIMELTSADGLERKKSSWRPVATVGVSGGVRPGGP